MLCSSVYNLFALIGRKATGWNVLIFSMEHPWGKEIQVCSNKVPKVIKIYREMLKKSSKEEPSLPFIDPPRAVTFSWWGDCEAQ